MYVRGVESGVVAFTQQCIQSNLTHVGGVKVHRELSIQSNVNHIKGVESSSINTIRAVMPCMSKVLKEAQNGLEHFCS